MFANFSYNLYELGIAALRDPQEPRLVSNLNCTAIYAEGVGLGKFWSYFYWQTNYLDLGDFKQQKLRSTIDKLREVFHSEKALALAAQADYKKALIELATQVEVPGERLFAARKTLTEWHAATSLFTKLLGKKESAALHEKLKGEDFTPFLTAEELQEMADLRRFYKIILLEGHLQEALPIALLRTAACVDGSLAKSEEKLLKEFAKKIDTCSPTVSVRVVDGALKALVGIFRECDPLSQPDLMTLRIALIYQKCTIFRQQDEKHQAWVASLKAGDTLVGDKCTYILGERIQNREINEVVFTAENDPAVELSFAMNKVIPELGEWTSNTFGWGLRSAKYLDKGKGFAVMERLDDSLAAFQWTSQGMEISKEDLAVATPLANLYEWFMGEDECPEGFLDSPLFFSSDGVLTTRRFLGRGEANFMVFVKHALKYSKGNQAVYKFIVKPLQKHRNAMFFEAVVKNCFSDTPLLYGLVRGRWNILSADMHTLCAVGEKLHNRVMQLKNDLVQEYPLEIVSEAITTCYDQGSYIGILPEDFEAKMKETLKPSVRQ